VNESKYSSAVPRAATLVAGIVSALFGVPLLLGGGFAVFRLLEEPASTSGAVIACIALVVGIFMSYWAFRLTSNKPRSDGGLMSPWALRIGGVFLIGAAPFYVLARHSPVSVWHALGLVSAGLACFAMASHRERHRG